MILIGVDPPGHNDKYDGSPNHREFTSHLCFLFFFRKLSLPNDASLGASEVENTSKPLIKTILTRL